MVSRHVFTGGFFSTGGPNGLAFATGLFVVIVNAGGGDVNGRLPLRRLAA